MNSPQFLKKINWTRVFSILMIANFLMNIRCVYAEVCDTIRISTNSDIGWGISELLINWQGGYVRRGLFGELLFRLCESTGCQPIPIIISICIISFVFFSVVFFIMLKKKDICWWIIFLPFTLGGMPIVRKDYICFLLVLLILYLLKTTFKSLWIKLSCIYTASCLLLHIHEAFFFVIVPFVVVYLYFYEFSAWSNKVAKFIFAAVPLFVLFGIICRYHGDENTAHIIHESWVKLCPCFTDYKFTQGDSIGAIGWKTTWTIRLHLKQSFLIYKPFILLLIYYLTGRYLSVFNSKSKDVSKDQSVLNAILLFQFIMLIPLFTVLSCDVCRICAYWTVSAICIYCILGSEISQIFSEQEIVSHTVKRIDSLFDYIFKPSKVLLCLLMLFIVVPQGGGHFWGISSVYNGFVHYTERILEKVIK